MTGPCAAGPGLYQASPPTGMKRTGRSRARLLPGAVTRSARIIVLFPAFKFLQAQPLADRTLVVRQKIHRSRVDTCTLAKSTSPAKRPGAPLLDMAVLLFIEIFVPFLMQHLATSCLQAGVRHTGRAPGTLIFRLATIIF